MKFSKKLMLIVLISILSFSLVGCDYSYHFYNRDNREKGTILIELVNYNDPSIIENPLANHPLDLTKIEVLEILSNDQIDEFTEELYYIEGLSGKPREVINSHNGIGIRITHNDNSFRLITVTSLAVANDTGSNAVFIGDYDENGNILVDPYGFSWPELIDEFKALLSKYFDIETEQ